MPCDELFAAPYCHDCVIVRVKRRPCFLNIARNWGLYSTTSVHW